MGTDDRTHERKHAMEKYQLFLNGEWQSGSGVLTVVDPATDQAFAEVATIDRAGARQALHDAEAAFAGWRKLTAKERGDYLRAVANELAARKDKVARCITMENGKPLPQALGEVAMTVDHLLWYAEEGRRAYGRVVPNQADGKRHLVIRQPVGVVGAIAPWNFPLVLAIRKVAPALAAGCPVVLKPASATPLSALEFARCVEAAGMPKGVFQVVVGPASAIADEMLENPVCRKISFTGSTSVGKYLIGGAAKKCTLLALELGGNAPLIIFDDADFDAAIEGALITKFRNTGQSCIAANRVYVHRPIYDRFLQALVARVKALKVGNGLEAGVDIGPMIDAKALAAALAFVDDAVAGGAKVLAGGRRHGDKGNFLQPTVLVDVAGDSKCLREEIFAPIAVVLPFDTEEQVLALANDTEFGLAAYAFTSDLNRAFRVGEKLEAGTVGINDPVPSTSNCPFGGFKQSGWGRELGSEGLDAYLETKHISIAGIR
ncbi:MAG: NAD-dependent succinate-semialdehyde dehydrogenase [Betaproteobacteria bacterium]|jgi:succinate-semialdehyde dehydrogenase/glutarate-semialdehyde dehydrogenase|nr:NAD-dependent succinate-semialdehyde dehydrogenase [Betaproteobacteria bacterium]